MGVCNCLLGCVNTFILCLSLPILLAGYFLKISANSPCDPIMYKPLITLGLCLLIISLIGLVGTCCRASVFQWLYLLTLLVSIIGLLACLSVGAVLIRSRGNGEDVIGDVKEYELAMFSKWMKNNIVSSDHWEDVVNCMVHHDACGRVGTFRTLMDFVTSNKSKLTSMEIGCCKPPVHCEYEYQSSTRWEVPEQGLASQDEDCKAWSNDWYKLCYYCDTCKAGYLAIFIKGWKIINFLNFVLLVVLFFIFVIACCALR